MADGALREDVISALEAAPGVTVTRVSLDTIEIAKPDQPLRTYRFKTTVCRGLLFEFERYYGVQMASFYPLPFGAVKKNVS